MDGPSDDITRYNKRLSPVIRFPVAICDLRRNPSIQTNLADELIMADK